MNINIITSRNEDWYSRQFSPNDLKNHNIHVNSHDDICWDIVVVVENLPHNFTVRCKKGGLILITGEPPLSSFYSKLFLSQFSIVLTSHKKLLHPNVVISQQSLPWLIGLSMGTKRYNLDYKDLSTIIPQKDKNISTICSFKELIPGHKKRNRFVKKILDRYKDKIECYGRGYKYIDDKADAILPYRFHLCIENSTIDDYWSEKFTDSLLGLSVPIYIGCTNIDKYFPENDFYIKLDINNQKDAFSKLDQIIIDGNKIYEEKLSSLIRMRSFLLKNYNIIPTIMNIKNKIKISEEEQFITLYPKSYFSDYNKELIKMKILRTILKLKQ